MTTALLTCELQFWKTKKILSGHKDQEVELKKGMESHHWLRCWSFPKPLYVSTAVYKFLMPNVTELPKDKLRPKCLMGSNVKVALALKQAKTTFKSSTSIFSVLEQSLIFTAGLLIPACTSECLLAFFFFLHVATGSTLEV